MADKNKAAVKKQMVKKKGSASQRKGKKKWFKTVTPEYMRSVELSEILAYEPSELPGRTLQVPLKEVTGSMRDSSSNIKFRIMKVQGETCQLEPIMILMQNSHVQRIDRRAKERILTIVDEITKDKQNIRVKAYLLLNNKISRTTRTALQATARNIITTYVKMREAKDVFATTTPKVLSNTIKAELKSIYPTSVLIWRISRK
jgi:small subunit ribosomal protein S3Ae